MSLSRDTDTAACTDTDTDTQATVLGEGRNTRQCTQTTSTHYRFIRDRYYNNNILSTADGYTHPRRPHFSSTRLYGSDCLMYLMHPYYWVKI